MTFWTAEALRDAVQGRWLSRPSATAPDLIERVTTDSREAGPGVAFVALKGESTDGHRFLASAADAGCPLVVIHTEAAATTDLRDRSAVLIVPDTGAALLRLAAYYRRHLEGTRVIAVGGSNGKTTTVRLIDQLLSTELRGSASKKSFNNAVGVPLTILAAKKGDHFLICEVGTNAPGEIGPLVDVIRPDIAVLTSIGREHLEGLGNLEGVVREEISLLGGLKPGGLAVLPADSRELRVAVRRLAAAGSQPDMKCIWFGTSPDADLRLSGVRTTLGGTDFTLNDRDTFHIPLSGAHNAANAAAAVAVARRMGISAAAILAGLAKAQGPPMRMELLRLETPRGPIAFLNDTYNANPDSMLGVFDTFFAIARDTSPGRLVLVLGDMLELGDLAPAMHREVLSAARSHLAAAAQPSLTVLVGPHMAGAANELKGFDVVRLESTTPEHSAAAAALFRPDDLVVLKGSRGSAIDRILDAFMKTVT